MRRAATRVGLIGLLLMGVTSCSTPQARDAEADERDGAADVFGDVADGASEAAVPCVNDRDCADPLFCNGVERCMVGAPGADARGCVAANPTSPCVALQTCDEASDRCVSDCGMVPDADGDGHASVLCHGDDCDDADPARFPGNPEVCDAADHDEDCDARTFGARDTDGDGFTDALCCNTDAMHARVCGDDCNDMSRPMNPRAQEVCDGLDNDCDGMVDNGGVMHTYYRDADGDGFGSASATAPTMTACAPPVGYVATNTDCDDANSGANPAAPEVCDGVDNNCSGTTDEGVSRAFFRDADGDGFGNPDVALTMTACSPPPGYVGSNTDCDDTNGGRNPGSPEVCDTVDNDCDAMVDEGVQRTFYVDADRDGFGSPAAGAMTTSACAPPPGFAPNRLDCDDANGSRNPAAPEVCDTLDNNCDGIADDGVSLRFFRDADGDGYGSPDTSMVAMGCTAPAGYASNSLDCDDALAARNPAAPEVCDGLDNNCNGTIDESAMRTFYRDADGDGFGSNAAGSTTSACTVPAGYATNNSDCDDTTAARNPAATEACDGIDNNCNTTVDEGTSQTFFRDADGDGYGLATATTTGCAAPSGFVVNSLDCDDTTAARNPAATEICDGLDNNCNTTVDEGALVVFHRDADGDGFGSSAAGSTTAACAAPTGYVANSADCDDTTAARNPAATEICDGLDNNCNTTVDEGVMLVFHRDADGDGFGSSAAGSTTTACAAPSGYVANTADCDDTAAARNPAATEVCDGIDNNCNATVDEGLTQTFYRDADADGFGTTGTQTTACLAPAGYVANSLDCDDTTRARNPAATEVCDGLDNNCNGLVDDGALSVFFRDADNDGFGDPAMPSMRSCTGAAGYSLVSGDCDDASAQRNPGAAERCNGIDDNCNALLDGPGEDVDHDGYADTACGGMDCNDGRPDVHPGATEICDGVDSDCNTRLDGPGEDDDLDGFADSACAGAGGLDCNDAVATTHAGAPELCNGVDDDCNGSTAGEDADGDSHAPTAATCITRAGLFPKDDCDDSNAAIYTGAAEVCDGVDNNCAGGVDEAALADAACATGRSNVLAVCSAGRCIVNCTSGSGDCDGVAANGCETNTQTSPFHCGGCGITCGRAGVCTNGLCDNVTQMDAGGGQTVCAVRGAGGVVCWGSNSTGQLGDGAGGGTSRSTTAVAVTGLTDAVEVAVGGDHACARRSTGGVSCWGANPYGQLGNGTLVTALTPVATIGLPGAVSEIAAGSGFTCARMSTGGVRCWGRGDTGQLGNGTTANSATPVVVSGIANAVEITAGEFHACARLATGAVMCWGFNTDGLLGNGGSATATTPVAVSGLADAVEIDAGAYTTCARRATGVVACWGNNSFNQIVGGVTPVYTTPVASSAPAGAVQIGVGRYFVCARYASAVRCWGHNLYGQVGMGSTVSPQTAPQIVLNLPDPVSLTLGDTNACVRRASGTLSCWGSNSEGEQGNGTMVQNLAAAGTSPLMTVSEVSAGGMFTCARRPWGQVACWGNDASSQLGDGGTASQPAPVMVQSLNDATMLVTGSAHACARRATGGVVCWGDNNEGQLGDGTTARRTVPTAVTGLANVVEIVAGWQFTCARLNTGSVSCWGSNTQGQLGDGSWVRRLTATPTLLATSPAIVQLAAGYWTACARRANGQVVCWGWGAEGELGDGTTTMARTTPGAAVLALTDAISLGSGSQHLCAVRASGPTVCWGDNADGDLGDGTGVPRNSPVTVVGLTDATQVALGNFSSCARRANGGVACWGRNSYGQLGNGGVTDSPYAVPVTSLTDALQIASGFYHVCARRTAGGVSCWGWNTDGQLGVAAPAMSSTPVDVTRLP